MADLDWIQREANRISQANGFDPARWGDKHEVPAKIALIHSEASEALEAFRHGDPVNFAEELADIIIRVADLAEAIGINLGSEVAAKMARNEERAHKHGGKRL